MTSILSATVIYQFQHVIEKHILLAVLMPIVASLGGNTGSQTLAVSIRSLALNEIQLGEQVTICLREFFKGLCNGMILGVVSGSLGWIITHDAMMSLVLFLACMLNMGVAGLAGASIPLLLKRFHFDPAQSSSIFLTAITDFTGFMLFLGLGSWLILS
jgi:magnesium transporter